MAERWVKATFFDGDPIWLNMALATDIRQAISGQKTKRPLTIISFPVQTVDGVWMEFRVLQPPEYFVGRLPEPPGGRKDKGDDGTADD